MKLRIAASTPGIAASSSLDLTGAALTCQIDEIYRRMMIWGNLTQRLAEGYHGTDPLGHPGTSPLFIAGMPYDLIQVPSRLP